MNFKDSLEAFEKDMNNCLLGNAQSKGYGDKENGGRAFFDSVDSECSGHAAGEIRYKIKRWQAKKNPEDLIKIAAWAFLIWDQNERLGGKDEPMKAGTIIGHNCTHPYHLFVSGSGASFTCQYTECRCKCEVCMNTHGG